MTIEEAMNLINCPKEVTDKPNANYRIDKNHRRKDFTCSSVDRAHSFRIFINIHDTFIENFSVGLIYLPKDGSGSFILMRCNGRHGANPTWPHHNYFHIHYVDKDLLSNGIYAESHIEQTTAYSNVEEAIWYFINRINILNPDKHFSQPQGQLF